jgi:hypothetical protein
MARKVQFDAHKKVKQPAEVKFKTRQGEKVKFVAEKKVSVPVRVKFMARDDKK